MLFIHSSKNGFYSLLNFTDLCINYFKDYFLEQF